MRSLPQSITSWITPQFLIKDEGEDDSRTVTIGQNDAVVFVNPTKYSLQAEDSDEENQDQSAFGDIVEERKGDENSLEKLK